MRIIRSHSVLALFTAITVAQEPPAPTPTPAPEPPAVTEPAPPAADNPEQGQRRRGQRRQPIVLEAAVVHPVAGPAIQDGVVVIRGERIIAVGKKGEVEVPENATVRSFPTGHLYPGLIDAHTDAFTDSSLRNDEGSDGGALFADDLRRQADRGDEMVQAGITTAYVTVRSPALVRGQGAIVRPRADGFEPWRGREHAALQLRMTGGPVPSHPLQRQQQLQAVDALFEGLDEFRKARTDHEEALKKYEKEFADYLAFHQKKKDAEKKPDAKADEAPKEGERPAASEGQGPPREGRRGGRGGPPPSPTPTPNPTPTPPPQPTPDPPKEPGANGPTAAAIEAALVTLFEALAQDPPKQDPGKQEPPKPAGQEGAAPPAGGKTEEPKRPTYPKAPPPDAQREALLRVIDGELPLRVEAHRPDELRAALRMQRERQIPQLILEQAYGAATLAADIARQGASVVLTETLPASLPEPYDVFDTASLPAKLHAAGVPFALATGRARNASLLPLLAAAAAGAGLDREAALRAITLTPAEILGIAQDTGSLQPGKLADVLVCDRPLFATDSRVLLVLAKGRTEFTTESEVK